MFVCFVIHVYTMRTLLKKNGILISITSRWIQIHSVQNWCQTWTTGFFKDLIRIECIFIYYYYTNTEGWLKDIVMESHLYVTWYQIFMFVCFVIHVYTMRTLLKRLLSLVTDHLKIMQCVFYNKSNFRTFDTEG
jgi:hypothetical protein